MICRYSGDWRVYRRLVPLSMAPVSPPPAISSTRIWHFRWSVLSSSCAGEETGKDNRCLKRNIRKLCSKSSKSISPKRPLQRRLMPTSEKSEQKTFQRYQIRIDELFLRKILLHIHLLRRRRRGHRRRAGFSYSRTIARMSAGQSGRPRVAYYANWSLISIAMRPSCVRWKSHKRKSLYMCIHNIYTYLMDKGGRKRKASKLLDCQPDTVLNFDDIINYTWNFAFLNIDEWRNIDW